MPLIGVSASSEKEASAYVRALESRGASTRLLLPSTSQTLQEQFLGLSGLLLTGGEDIHPRHYNQKLDSTASLELLSARDELEFDLLQQALTLDLPVLAICRGMQVLNVAFGGRLIQNLPGHRVEPQNGEWQPSFHQVYLSPGSKLAAILGTGGFFRVNSIHHQGLREPHKAPGLLASAYSLDDWVIEGLESPQHTWVVGVQCHPEREEEVPKVFGNLFLGFIEFAERAQQRLQGAER